MSKKDRKKRHNQPAVPSAPTDPLPSISRRGWRLLGAGIGVAALGYVLLSFTDPGGQNWASRLSPIVILSGYVLMGIGFAVK